MSVHEVDCLLESMNSVLELLGDLDDSDWQARSLCPAWRVRQVVAHLDGIEEALRGWRPAGDTPAPFEIVGKVSNELDDWSPDQVLPDPYRHHSGRFRLRSSRRSCCVDPDAQLAPCGSEEAFRVRANSWHRDHNGVLAVVVAGGANTETMISNQHYQ